MSDPVSFPAIRTAGRDNETFVPICTAIPSLRLVQLGHPIGAKSPALPSRPVTLYQREGQGLTPGVESEGYGRDGILAHTYMLGANGQSNGCRVV
jgi:hypothetical protein